MSEVLEFIMILLVPKTNVGGYVNTGWGLVFNLEGASIVAALIWWRGPLTRGDGQEEAHVAPGEPVRWKSTTTGRWSDAALAARVQTTRACRTRTPPRVNTLSSDPIAK